MVTTRSSAARSANAFAANERARARRGRSSRPAGAPSRTSRTPRSSGRPTTSSNHYSGTGNRSNRPTRPSGPGRSGRSSASRPSSTAEQQVPLWRQHFSPYFIAFFRLVALKLGYRVDPGCLPLVFRCAELFPALHQLVERFTSLSLAQRQQIIIERAGVGYIGRSQQEHLLLLDNDLWFDLSEIAQADLPSVRSLGPLLDAESGASSRNALSGNPRSGNDANADEESLGADEDEDVLDTPIRPSRAEAGVSGPQIRDNNDCDINVVTCRGLSHAFNGHGSRQSRRFRSRGPSIEALPHYVATMDPSVLPFLNAHPMNGATFARLNEENFPPGVNDVLKRRVLDLVSEFSSGFGPWDRVNPMWTPRQLAVYLQYQKGMGEEVGARIVDEAIDGEIFKEMNTATLILEAFEASTFGASIRRRLLREAQGR